MAHPAGSWRQHAGAVLNSPWAWLILFVLGTAWCFGPAVRGPFFFDDEHFIVRNVDIQSLSAAPKLYTTSVTAGSNISGNFYRPNQQLIYALLYHAYGTTTPVPYHLAPMVLHTLNAVLLQSWLVLLGFALPLAGAVALVFLVHPVQTEAVSYISGLADPLALAWMLVGLLCLCRANKAVGRAAWGWAIGTVVALVLALLSKENAVVFAPLAVATLLLPWAQAKKRPQAAAAAVLGATAVVVAVYLGLRFSVLSFGNSLGLSDAANVYNEQLSMRLMSFVSVLWDYARLIFYPDALFYEKPYRAYAGLLTARGIFGLLVLTGAVATWVRWRKAPRVAFATAVGLAALLPFVGVIPLNAIFLEHWLYVPMAGVALLLVLGCQAAARGKARPWLAAAAVVAVAALAARSHARSREWADAETFYLNELAQGGHSDRVLNNLGMYYADKRATNLAIHYYQEAAKSAGARRLPQPYHNLANLYASTGQVGPALEALQTALTIEPRFIYSLRLLRAIWEATGERGRLALTVDAIGKVERGEPYDEAAFRDAVFRH